jgi:hypothetical protein
MAATNAVPGEQAKHDQDLVADFFYAEDLEKTVHYSTLPPAAVIFSEADLETVMPFATVTGKSMLPLPRSFTSPRYFAPRRPASLRKADVRRTEPVERPRSASASSPTLKTEGCSDLRLIAEPALFRQFQNDVALRRADDVTGTGLLTLRAPARGGTALAAAADAFLRFPDRL